MQWRIVDINGTGKYICINRGFLQVFEKDDLVGSTGLDDLLGVVVCGHGHTISVPCLNRFAKLNISVAFCENNQLPFSYLVPVQGISEQSKRMIAQANASVPTKKKLWKQIIQAKISNQACVAKWLKLKCLNRLLSLSKEVKSGDSSNRESVAARIYWTGLFGKDFKRNRNLYGLNTLLNYGYTILRACVARAVVGTGLHTTLGVHHKGPTNGMCLVDDLMEPFRPIVDYLVWLICNKKDDIELSEEIKVVLAKISIVEVEGEQGSGPLSTAMFRMTSSLANIFSGSKETLFIPPMPAKEDIDGIVK